MAVFSFETAKWLDAKKNAVWEWLTICSLAIMAMLLQGTVSCNGSQSVFLLPPEEANTGSLRNTAYLF
jgi:hypothetical protein